MPLTLEEVLLNITDPAKWIDPDALMHLIAENPSLRGFTYGYVSEDEFVKYLLDLSIVDHYKDDDHKKTKSDRTFVHGGMSYSVQLKSLQTKSIKELKTGTFQATVQNDASDRRRVKLGNGEEIETTCYVVGEYDILAVSLQPFTGKWEFAFKKNKDLRRSTNKKYTTEQQRYLLATTEIITYPLDSRSGWATNLHSLLKDTDLGTVQQVNNDTKIVTPPGTRRQVIIEDAI